MSSQLFIFVACFIENIAVEFIGPFLLQNDFIKLFRLSKEFAGLRKHIKNLEYKKFLSFNNDGYYDYVIKYFCSKAKKIMVNFPYLIFSQNFIVTIDSNILKLTNNLNNIKNLFYSVKTHAIFKDDSYFYFLVENNNDCEIIENHIKHIQKIMIIFPHLIFELECLKITNKTDIKKLCEIICIQKNLFYSVQVDLLEFDVNLHEFNVNLYKCESSDKKKDIEKLLFLFQNIKIKQISFVNYKNKLLDNGICDISFLRDVEVIKFCTCDYEINIVNLDFLPSVKKIIFSKGPFCLGNINSKFVAEELVLNVCKPEFFWNEYSDRFELFKTVKKISINEIRPLGHGFLSSIRPRRKPEKKYISCNFQNVKELTMVSVDNLQFNFMPKLKKNILNHCHNISIN